jgi:hypothetical protein
MSICNILKPSLKTVIKTICPKRIQNTIQMKKIYIANWKHWFKTILKTSLNNVIMVNYPTNVFQDAHRIQISIYWNVINVEFLVSYKHMLRNISDSQPRRKMTTAPLSCATVYVTILLVVQGAVKGAVTNFPTPLPPPTLLALNSHKPKTPPSNKQQINSKKQCHPTA